MGMNLTAIYPLKQTLTPPFKSTISNSTAIIISLFIVSAISFSCDDYYGVSKCTFEKKQDNGEWQKMCQTFYDEDVIDPDEYCYKYQGTKTHCTTPSDTTYCATTEYRNPAKHGGECSTEDGIEM